MKHFAHNDFKNAVASHDNLYQNAFKELYMLKCSCNTEMDIS